MKTLFRILLPCIVLFASINFVKAGGDSTYTLPTYQLRVTNYTYTPDTFEFDIYIKHTNPQETNFELAGHQYFFRINPALLPQGSTFTYRYAITQQGDTLSGLPAAFRPRNPSTAGNLLRLATNSLPGAGNGFTIDTAGLGVRVLRMRVGLSAGTFNTNVPYYFNIVDTITAGSFFTKINAYTGLNNTVNTQISYTMFHSVDSSLTGINNGSPVSTIIPKEFELSQNYPNPFNPVTKIQYALPVSGNVQLKIFDMTGREIANLVNEVKPAGNYSVNFNGADFASGVYFYRIDVSGEKEFKSVKRMVLIK